MRLSPKTIMTAAAATAVTVALPVTVALSKVDPGAEIEAPAVAQAPMQAPTAGDTTTHSQAHIPQATFAAHGRPMDDISGEGFNPDFAQGDLSIFDDIQEIGMDQSVDVPYCDHHAALTATLDHDFAEAPRMERDLDNDRSVELWASDVMGTWTAIYNRADGVACVVSSGIGWEADTSPMAVLESEGLLQAG